MDEEAPSGPQPEYKPSRFEHFFVFFFLTVIVILALLTVLPGAATSVRSALGVHP